MRTKLLLAVVFLLLTPAAASADEGYRVIAHPETKILSVERTFLKDVFLKKATRWPGDEVVHPSTTARRPRCAASSRRTSSGGPSRR